MTKPRKFVFSPVFNIKKPITKLINNKYFVYLFIIKKILIIVIATISKYAPIINS